MQAELEENLYLKLFPDPMNITLACGFARRPTKMYSSMPPRGLNEYKQVHSGDQTWKHTCRAWHRNLGVLDGCDPSSTR